MSGLIRLGIYLGIGALLHALFVGAHFDWSSVWTWVWLVGWPIMLFVTFWTVVISIVIVLLIVIGVATLAGKL
jgi:hypothetical protein